MYSQTSLSFAHVSKSPSTRLSQKSYRKMKRKNSLRKEKEIQA